MCQRQASCSLCCVFAVLQGEELAEMLAAEPRLLLRDVRDLGEKLAFLLLRRGKPAADTVQEVAR